MTRDCPRLPEIARDHPRSPEIGRAGVRAAARAADERSQQEREARALSRQIFAAKTIAAVITLGGAQIGEPISGTLPLDNTHARARARTHTHTQGEGGVTRTRAHRSFPDATLPGRRSPSVSLPPPPPPPLRR